MGEEMEFPNTFEEFLNYYAFKDREEVYTNGSELIQTFRVMQGYDHFSNQIKDELLDKVAEKLKTKVMICANCEIIGCDTVYFEPMCEKAKAGIFATEFSEYVDDVITEMKAEVKNND